MEKEGRAGHVILSFSQFLKERPERSDDAKMQLKRDMERLMALQERDTGELLGELASFEGRLSSLLEGEKLAGTVGELERILGEIAELEQKSHYLRQLVEIETRRDKLNELLSKDDMATVLPVLGELIDLARRAIGGRAKEHVEKICQDASKHLEDQLERLLMERAAQVGWPKAVPSSTWKSDETIAFLEAFDFAVIYANLKGESNVYRRAVHILLTPIRIQFLFHFATSRPTNRLDKPEWLLSHLSSVLDTHKDFILDCLELEAINGSVGDGLRMTCQQSVLEAFAEGLAEMASEQFKRRREATLADPYLLMHTVRQCLAFCQNIRDMTKNCYDGRIILEAIFEGEQDRKAWLDVEREALQQAYELLMEESPTWIEERIERRGEGASLIKELIILIEQSLEILQRLSFSPELQVCLLTELIIPILEELYEKIDFDIPPFHATSEDIHVHALLANSIDLLLDKMRRDWGARLDLVALGGSEEFVRVTGYRASELLGSIFDKSIRAFEELQEKVINHLYGYLWESFSSLVLAFSRAMHYGVLRGERTDLVMHDDLRRALVVLIEATRQLSTQLGPITMAIIEDRLMGAMDGLFFERVILKNYFNSDAVERFTDDLNQVKVTLQGLFPAHDAQHALLKSLEGARILSVDSPTRREILNAVEDGNVDRLAHLLDSLSIGNLTGAECEKILLLYRE